MRHFIIYCSNLAFFVRGLNCTATMNFNTTFLYDFVFILNNSPWLRIDLCYYTYKWVFFSNKKVMILSEFLQGILRSTLPVSFKLLCYKLTPKFSPFPICYVPTYTYTTNTTYTCRYSLNSLISMRKHLSFFLTLFKCLRFQFEHVEIA